MRGDRESVRKTEDKAKRIFGQRASRYATSPAHGDAQVLARVVELPLGDHRFEPAVDPIVEVPLFDEQGEGGVRVPELTSFRGIAVPRRACSGRTLPWRGS